MHSRPASVSQRSTFRRLSVVGRRGANSARSSRWLTLQAPPSCSTLARTRSSGQTPEGGSATRLRLRLPGSGCAPTAQEERAAQAEHPGRPDQPRLEARAGERGRVGRVRGGGCRGGLARLAARSSSSWRPQEILGPQVFDLVVRNLNANRTSTVRAEGERAKLGFVITTGDLADNQQLNETRWFTGVLEGGTVDPFSGKPISATNPCGGATPDEVAALNAAVAARAYTGVADYDDYRGVPVRALRRVLGPGRGAARGWSVRGVPALPGAARARAEAVPGRGSEGAVVHRSRQPRRARAGQRAREHGHHPRDRHGLPEGLPVRPLDPAAVRRPRRERRAAADREPAVPRDAAGSREKVPPDPDRRILSTVEYKLEVGASHGYRPGRRLRAPRLQEQRDLLLLPPAQGHRADLARHRRRGRWPVRQPRQPAVPLAREDVDRRAEGQAARDRLRPPHAGDDEQHPHRRGGRLLQPTAKPGCDGDPRKSTPLHRGPRAPRTCATCS